VVKNIEQNTKHAARATQVEQQVEKKPFLILVQIAHLRMEVIFLFWSPGADLRDFVSRGGERPRTRVI